MGNASLVSVSRETGVFGLDIVPANHNLVLLDKVLYGQKGYEFYLRNGLEMMGQGFYDAVLMDCPPSFGTLTLNALTAADLLIIPTQCEFFAARSLRRIIELVKLVREKTNPKLTFRILVTMFDRRNKISRLILEQMQRSMSDAMFDTVIEVDVKLKESPVFGKPITTYAPNTRGAQQYSALAKELTNHG